MPPLLPSSSATVSTRCGSMSRIGSPLCFFRAPCATGPVGRAPCDRLPCRGLWRTMEFDDLLTHVLDLLRREGRVSYRALKVRFQLDDAVLEALKDEIIDAKRLAVDEQGKLLV